MPEVSELAFKLWRLLTARPGTYNIDQATRDLGASKTKIQQALLELEEKGLIGTEIENDCG